MIDSIESEPKPKFLPHAENETGEVIREPDSRFPGGTAKYSESSCGFLAAQ